MVNCTSEQAMQILAKVQAAGFDKAEVMMTASDMTEMQVDAGDVSLMRSTEDLDMSIRGIRGGRYAVVSLNQTDEESLKAGLKKLNNAIESAPVDSARAFAPKQVGVNAVSEGPVEPNLEQMYSRMSEFVGVTSAKYPALQLEQSGVQFRRSRFLRVNSEGL